MSMKKLESPLPESKISTNDAVKYCHEQGINITLVTLIRWCEKYKVGKKVVGTWYVDKNKLKKLLHGGTEDVICSETK